MMLRKMSITALALALTPLGGAKQRTPSANPQLAPNESGLSLISDAKTGTILVEARLNAQPVVMILDTGASRTMFDAGPFGISSVDLQAARMNRRGIGIDADVVWRVADFSIADRSWTQQQVQVADLRPLAKIYGRKIDGIVGQDVLRQFASVKINYKGRCVMLEE